MRCHRHEFRRRHRRRSACDNATVMMLPIVEVIASPLTMFLLLLLVVSSSSFISPLPCCHGLSSPSPSWIATPTRTRTQLVTVSSAVNKRSRSNGRSRIAVGGQHHTGSSRTQPNTKHRSVFYGYLRTYSPTNNSRSSHLFSRRPGEDFDDDDVDSIDDDEDREKGLFVTFFSDVLYGANHVHNNFLNLSWKLYSRTILYTTPFVVILFMVLPSLLSSSSSPHHQLLATNVQGFLQRAFTILAEFSDRFYLNPLKFVIKLMPSSPFSNINNSNSRSVWSGVSGNNNAKKRLLVWGLLWGPIMEELVFRFGFYKLWTTMFRPMAVQPNSSSDKKRANERRNDKGRRLTTTTASTPQHDEAVSSSRSTSESNANNYWMIVSGLCFGIAHFTNFLPIDIDRYRDNSGYSGVGEILLPSGSLKERILLRLFPQNFVLQEQNKEFCLVNMILTGAIYQAMHCCINTVILYGPLFKSSPGGIGASIGAHIAWNANVIWLVSNIKLRIFSRVVTGQLRKRRQQRLKETETKTNNNDGNET